MLFITQDTDLVFNEPLSLVYYYAPWLAFHKNTLQTITKLEAEFKGVKFYAVDISQFEKLITRFKVASLPTVQLMGKGGKLLKSVIGINALNTLDEKLADIYYMMDDNKELR